MIWGEFTKGAWVWLEFRETHRDGVGLQERQELMPPLGLQGEGQGLFKVPGPLGVFAPLESQPPGLCGGLREDVMGQADSACSMIGGRQANVSKTSTTQL